MCVYEQPDQQKSKLFLAGDLRGLGQRCGALGFGLGTGDSASTLGTMHAVGHS